jgi:TPP-dependent pyruvate/acetoin dehydrogenase alpha subunit
MSESRSLQSRYKNLYQMARLIRRSQEMLMEEYHPADEMRCPIHFCLGQESAPAALSQHLRDEDVMMSHHRSHGYYLAKGGNLSEMVAELFGKATGCNGGLAGSQELSRHESNFFSGTILSGMFAMSTGAAFAQKYRGTDDLTVAVIGDGGMEEGIVFEALNLAAVFNLPILFVCENNLYSAHTRIEKRSLSKTLIRRAEAFGVKTHLLDGNDPLLLDEAFAQICEDIRGGNGPVFIEVQTYRVCGHVGPEDDDILNYRTPEELQKWLSRDPVAYLRAALLSAGTRDSDIVALEASIDSAVSDAIAKAKQAPFPDFDEAINLNSANTFSELVVPVNLGTATQFDGNQSETKLMPY